MISHARLLEQAKKLIGTGQGKPNQTDLRRAVSSSYYAVFHRLLAAVSDHLVGATAQTKKRPEYRLVYRALDHRSMREACASLTKRPLPPMVRQATGRANFGPEILKCAAAFVELQESRQAADYDPARRFTKFEATTLIATAEDAIKSYQAAPQDEQQSLIYLFAFKVRA